MDMKKIKPRKYNWMSVVLQEDMMHVWVIGVIWATVWETCLGVLIDFKV